MHKCKAERKEGERCSGGSCVCRCRRYACLSAAWRSGFQAPCTLGVAVRVRCLTCRLALRPAQLRRRAAWRSTSPASLFRRSTARLLPPTAVGAEQGAGQAGRESQPSACGDGRVQGRVRACMDGSRSGGDGWLATHGTGRSGRGAPLAAPTPPPPAAGSPPGSAAGRTAQTPCARARGGSGWGQCMATSPALCY